MMDMVLAFLAACWDTFSVLAPWLLFGFFVAGILSVVISPQTVERHLGQGRWGGIVKAALIGVPLPICSCGVIPVATTLRRHGANKGAVASFLASTPVTGVDSLFVTATMLGWFFALYRVGLAFLNGLVGGLAVSIVAAEAPPSRDIQTTASTDAHANETSSTSSVVARIFQHAFITLPRDINTHLVIGVLIAGCVVAFVPDGFLEQHGVGGIWAMLAVLALAVPLYVCSTGSVPIAAALMMKGVSPGAALVFLMAGPATNAALIAAMVKVLGMRETIAYVASVVVVALGGGVLLNIFYHAAPWHAMSEHAALVPLWVNDVSAIFLAVVLIASYESRLKSLLRQHKKAVDSIEVEGVGVDDGNAPLNGLVLHVTGMTCEHCAATVASTARSVEGVLSVDVRREEGTVRLSFAQSPRSEQVDAVVRAIQAAGYDAVQN